MAATAAGKLAFVRGEVRLPDSRTVGDALATGLDPWIEQEVLGPAFAQRDDGMPRFSLVYVELARGHWKTGGVAAIALAEALLEPGTDVVVAAGDVEQAGIDLAHLDGYCDRNPSIGSLVTRRGNERVFEGGSRIRVISSDAPTAWGLGGERRRFRVIAEELTIWSTEDLWSALVSSTGKVPDTQTLVLSNAGFDPTHSWQWRVREAARTQPWGHLYSAPGVVASWVTDAWVEQQRALLPPAAFDRVIGNAWTTGAGDFVTAAQYHACVDERLARTSSGCGGYAGLDLGLTRDRTALATVQRDADEVILRELDVWQGTKSDPVSITGIERAVLDLHRRRPGIRFSADPWQLRGSVERLRRERVRIDEFTFSASSVQTLSTTLYGAISTAALRVYPDTELEREILGLRVVKTSSGWRFDHRAGGFSDRAVALAMGIELAQRRPPVRPGRAYAARGNIGDPLAVPAQYRGVVGVRFPATADRRPSLDQALAADGVVARDGLAELDQLLARGRAR